MRSNFFINATETRLNWYLSMKWNKCNATKAYQLILSMKNQHGAQHI